MLRQASSLATTCLLASSLSRCGALVLRHPAASLFRTPSRRRSSSATAAVPTEQQEYVAGLAFDLETTGLDTGKAEIVQFAVVIANSQQGAKFSRLVLPQGEIDPGASSVHGFTREVLVERGAQPFADVWAECESWLKETLGSDTRPLVWAAHNGFRFDKPILTRCVQEATGQPSALLSGPRVAFVDTYGMARSAMPNRPYELPVGARPYTLGSLYESAQPDGASLEGAHDALVDAEALAQVWRWLVDQQSADAASTQWSVGGTLQPFQAHLQYHGYRMPPPPKSSVRKPRTASRESTPVRFVRGDGSLERVAGIGPEMARKLNFKGIGTYDDLRDVWLRRGSDRRRMIGWLTKSMPKTNKMAIARAVKGMVSEWGPQQDVVNENEVMNEDEVVNENEVVNEA